MPNRLRGEIEAQLDGRSWVLVLTLGALAELEDRFACGNLNALVSRFASGSLSAGDIIAVLGAGLRGAGNDVRDDQVASMTTVGGAPGYAAIAADLLKATFGEDQDATSEKTTPPGPDPQPEDIPPDHEGISENPPMPQATT